MNIFAFPPQSAAELSGSEPAASAHSMTAKNHRWMLSLQPRWAAVLLTLWCTLALNAPFWSRLGRLPDFVDPWFWQRAAIVGLIACATYWWFMLCSWPGIRRIAWSATLLIAAGLEYYLARDGILMSTMTSPVFIAIIAALLS